jgi:hypothetical protein
MAVCAQSRGGVKGRASGVKPWYGILSPCQLESTRAHRNLCPTQCPVFGSTCRRPIPVGCGPENGNAEATAASGSMVTASLLHASRLNGWSDLSRKVSTSAITAITPLVSAPTISTQGHRAKTFEMLFVEVVGRKHTIPDSYEESVTLITSSPKPRCGRFDGSTNQGTQDAAHPIHCEVSHGCSA